MEAWIKSDKVLEGRFVIVQVSDNIDMTIAATDLSKKKMFLSILRIG